MGIPRARQRPGPRGSGPGCYLQFSIGGQAPVGELNQPAGLGIGDRGTLYVADMEHHVIQRISDDGRFLSLWGSPGSRQGQFFRPTAVVAYLREKVFVVDSGNHRIQVFRPDGTFLQEWGTFGGAAGQFNNPTAIAIKSDLFGTWLYVTDTGNGRVQVFTLDGVFLRQWGQEPGTVYGGLGQPVGVAVTVDNQVLVADRGRHRVYCFNANGAYLSMLPDTFSELAGLAAAPDRRVYVVEPRENRVSVYQIPSAGQPTFVARFGSYGSGNGQFKAPQGVAVRDDGLIFVADTGNNRVQVLTHEFAYFRQWGQASHAERQFDRPRGVAIGPGPGGEIVVFIADTGNSRIRVFTFHGDQLDVWGRWGNEPGSFDMPSDLAMAPNGDVYVVDTNNHRIQRFTAQGAFVSAWGVQGAENGNFVYPRGIGISAAGVIYIADTGNDRVQLFDANGAFLGKWDLAGGYDLAAPTDVVVAPNGTVYVSDTLHHCIKVYDAVGANEKVIGGPGTVQAKFSSPTYLAIWTPPSGVIAQASDCNHGQPLLYVVDTGNYRVQSFQLDGAPHLVWGSYGYGPDGFDLPNGIVVNADGRVYVADTNNDRIVSTSSAAVPRPGLALLRGARRPVHRYRRGGAQ